MASTTPRRAGLWGLLVGFVVTPVAAGAALLSSTAEELAPLLTPGAALLAPLQDRMASWPGLVNVLLGSLANGAVVGAACAALAAALRLWTARR